MKIFGSMKKKAQEKKKKAINEAVEHVQRDKIFEAEDRSPIDASTTNPHTIPYSTTEHDYHCNHQKHKCMDISS